MKAISLHQPWASFIAAGIKPFETRDWAPPRWLIGKRIAIHAAKKAVGVGDREWATRCEVHDLPLGAVVCTALLAGAYQCGAVGDVTPPPDVFIGKALPGSPHKSVISADAFGDYTPGRWAWWLTDIERVEPPIPARGMQGFWNYQELSGMTRYARNRRAG